MTFQIGRILGISLLVHLIGGLIAGGVIVAKIWISEPAPTFVIQPVENAISHEVMEPSRASSESEAAMGAPPSANLIQSTRASDFALPELPAIPMASLTPSDRSGILGTFGVGAGQGMDAGSLGSTGVFGGSGMNFFGIADRSESVVLLLDISASMFTRLGPEAFEIVKDQALRLIDALGVNSRFGIVVWGGTAGKWKSELVPATDANREAAREFVRVKLQPRAYQNIPRITEEVLHEGEGGTRHDLALRLAFSLQPEVLYLLSDGNALRGREVIPTAELLKLVQVLQSERSDPARLHTIYFLTGPQKPQERELLQKLATRNQGQFTEFSPKQSAAGSSTPPYQDPIH